MSTLRIVSSLLLAIALSGCAGLWNRVDRGLLDDVPNEEKLLLFDAENGVYIAKDEMDTAERAYGDAERALLRARNYRKVIQERKKSGAVVDTPAVLSLLEQWNDARMDMRKAEVEWARQRRRSSTAGLWASRARYEQAKAKLVKDHNPVDGTKIELEAFEKQVSEKEAREKEENDKLAEKEAAVSEKRAVYNKLSTKLQALSGGAYGGPWADLAD
jgi:hypothetical protein